MRTPFHRAVVVGGGGMLAREFRERVGRGDSALPEATTFLARESCDVGDGESVRRAIGSDVDLVINCAAYTDVDRAEQEEALATRINGAAVSLLASRCAEVGATLVHFSTDYVFDGRGAAPYPVDHPRAPLGAYGRSKAAGEEALERSECDRLCLRTSWLYAPWGKNFVRTIVRLARERDTLRVVDDQRGRPTSVATLAHLTESLLARGARGTMHACDGGECTWHGFATEIAAWANPRCRVEPCSTAEFPRPAPRPAYSVLDLRATEESLGAAIPDWRGPLRDTLERLEP